MYAYEVQYTDVSFGIFGIFAKACVHALEECKADFERLKASTGKLKLQALLRLMKSGRHSAMESAERPECRELGSDSLGVRRMHHARIIRLSCRLSLRSPLEYLAVAFTAR